MNQKYIAVAAILLSVWFSWLYRYDIHSNTMVLDRWTGSIISRTSEYSRWKTKHLSDAQTDKDRHAEVVTISPAPQAAMPTSEPSDPYKALGDHENRATTRKGMFDDLEYPADRNPGGMFDDIEAEMSGGKQKEKGQ